MSTTTTRALYLRAGTTWRIVLKKRDRKTCLPIDITGFKARGQVRSQDGTILLALDDDNFTIDAAAGNVTQVVSATDTATFNATDARIELVYASELYDDGVSPTVVTPLVDCALIVQPAALE